MKKINRFSQADGGGCRLKKPKKNVGLKKKKKNRVILWKRE